MIKNKTAQIISYISKVFGGKQKHIFIWGMLVIYLLFANQQYIQFFLKDGKPIDTNVNLPSPSQNIAFKLTDVMQPIQYNGQTLYEIKGYAFLAAFPEQINNIMIVLNSDTRNIIFPTRYVPIPDMIKSLSFYTSSMDQAEFSFLLSKNVLATGKYQIGIMLQPVGGISPSYVLTRSSIEKTPNTLKYLPAP
jgi:hypothetical protein